MADSRYTFDEEPIVDSSPRFTFDEEPGIIESSSRSLLQGLEQATRGLEIGALGLYDYIGDAFGNENNPFDTLIKKRKAEKANSRDLNIAGTGYETASNIIESAAPALGASIATGGFAAPGLLGLAKGFSDQYQDSRDNGRTFSEATGDASLKGAGESLGNIIESIPIVRGAKELGILGKASLAGLYGAGGNVLTDFTDIAADYSFNPETNIPRRLSGSALTGAAFGTVAGTAAEGLRRLGAKTLNDPNFKSQLDSLDDAKVDEIANKLNSEGVIQKPLEVIPQAEIDTPKSSILSDSEIPVFKSDPIAQDSGVYILEGADLRKAPAPKGLEVVTSSARTPQEMQAAAREIDVLQNTDTYNPSAKIIDPTAGQPNNILNANQTRKDPLFKDVVRGQRGEVLQSDNLIKDQALQQEYDRIRQAQFERQSKMFSPYPEAKPSELILDEIATNTEPDFVRQAREATPAQQPISMPERPLVKEEIRQITPEATQPKQPTFYKSESKSDFSTPIERVELNSPKESPTMEFSDPKTGVKILHPYEPEFKARQESLISDAEEVTKALRLARRNAQRGSISLDFFGLGKKDPLRAGRSPDFEHYDPDGILPVRVAKEKIRANLEYFRTTADKFPQARPIDIAVTVTRPEQFGLKIGQFRESSAPLFALGEKAQALEPYLRASRKAGKPLTPEFLKSEGFGDAEIDAVKAWYKTADEALDTVVDAAKVRTINRNDISDTDKNDIINALNNYANANKGKGYFPNMRFGDYYVDVKDAKGNTTHYSFHESASEAREAARKFKNQNPGLKVEWDKRQILPDEIYEELPRDIGGYLFFLENKNPGSAPKGVMANFMHAKHIDGADKDILKTAATYLQGVAKLHARAQSDPIINRTLNELKDSYPLIYAKSKRYLDELQTPGGKATEFWNNAVVPFYNWQYLAGNITNITLNLTEVVRAYSNTAHHLRDIPNLPSLMPERIAAKSVADASMSVLYSKDVNPEIRAAIDYGKKVGFIDDKPAREIFEYSRGRQSAPITAARKLNEFVATGNRKAEDFVKYYDYIHGFNVAKARGLEGVDAYRYAMYFTNDVKSSGQRSQQNSLLRNYPFLGLFRNYAFNQMRELARHTRNRDLPSTLRYLSPLFAIAGVQGLPFMKEVLSASDLYGSGDWKSDTRDKLKKLTNVDTGSDLVNSILRGIPDSVIYGPISKLTNLTFSNTAGFANIIPEAGEDGIVGQVGKTVLGATAALPTQIAKVGAHLSSGRPLMALEAALPTSAKQLVKGYRFLTEGLTDAQGNIIKRPENMTLMEKAAPFLNSQSLTVAKAYEPRNLARKMDEKVEKKIRKLNDRLFNSLLGRNWENPEDLIQQLSELDVTDESASRALKSRIERYSNSLLSDVKKLPKSQREEYLRRAMLID